MEQRLARRLILLGTMAATIGCDQTTKHVATATLAGQTGRSLLGDTVRIAYAENAGAFLSLGANLPEGTRFSLFTVGTALAILFLAVLALRSRWSGWRLLGATLLVAGGASNGIDRVLRGHVVDFLNVGLGSLRTGIFNVADVVIMVGAGILVVTMISSAPAEPSRLSR